MTRKCNRGVAKPHQPTSHERADLKSHVAKVGAKPSAPGLKFGTENGAERIKIDHPNESIGGRLLMEAMGTTDVKFFNSLINQLAVVGSKNGKKNEDAINFLLSVVKGIEPRDQVEAMLATQMAAVHIHAMNASEVLLHAESIAQQDSAERAFNKLMRTFAVQMDTLKRYRTGGQQKVTVEHVTVNDGGQAIVGNVGTGGRGRGKGRR